MSKPDTTTEATVRQHRIQGNDVDLNVLDLGRAEDPAVIMVHGLRDTAWALLPIAKHLIAQNEDHPGYRVLIAELRGHGASDRSDAYAMPNFLLDLYQVVGLTFGTCAMLGHSLGGHVVTKFAAMFPEIVQALLVVEGLGPPKRPYEGDEAREIKAYRDMLLSRVAGRSSRGRPIESIEDVTARLCRNNPRLDPHEAEQIAPHLVTEVDGVLSWSFDSRANSVFVGSNHADNARFWRQVQAPTCLISGTLSYQYWGREMAAAEFNGHFAEGEMEARANHFAHHEHHWFEHSGHMVHYDEPDRLGVLARNFLEQNYV